MRHRIFIAINLPENIKKELIQYQEKIEELFTPFQRFGKGLIRWTKKENLHITLIFLAYVNDENLLEICKIVKEVASQKLSFLINLKNILYGPSSQKFGRPRMIWAEGKKSKEFTSLRNDLEKSLMDSEKVHFTPEKRDFFPHITLGRIRSWEFRQIEPEERPEVNEEINLSFEVNSIEVMESLLKREGPEYTILEKVPFSK